MSDSPNTSVGWDGDVLGRKPTGDFLYNLTMQRFKAYHSKSGSGALCIAFDADWGAGKSFFINKWSKDIESLQHPVIKFDAWVNDLSDDPLLGFMAELQRAMEPYLQQLPVSDTIKASLKEKFSAARKQAQRAILPALTTLAKAAIKKTIGVDSGEFMEAITSGSLEGVAPDMDDARDLAGAGLQEYFDQALTAHIEKQKSIVQMKSALSKLLEELQSETEVKLPLFVLIDELDRCRPDYAIRLLEGIKHLFDVQGICFIFSTNLKQLSSSAQAVYGSGFDGYRYLKRFFSFEYYLPEPDHQAFARNLVDNSSFTDGRLIPLSALPPERIGNSGNQSATDILAKNFSLVAQAFRLDLRSQEQVFRIAEASTAGIQDGDNLYCLYIFFLSAAYHKGIDTFNSLSQTGLLYTTTMESLLHIPIESTGFNEEHNQILTRTSFKELIDIYTNTTDITLHDLAKIERNSTHERYPESIRYPICREGNGRAIPRHSMSSISSYFQLVKLAGQVTRAP